MMTSPVVFIVDDDESVRRALERLMRSAGFDVRAFASAKEFLDQDCQDVPGCLILDVRMPGMNGLELQEKLRTGGSHIPIVFITAHYDASTREQAMKAGAVEFIQKPFNDEVLLKAVDSGLSLSQDMESN
jgi:FixJ family two-component response regulator